MFVLLAVICWLGAASCQLLGLFEGDDCTPLRGGQGVCKLLNECTNIGDFKRDHPLICGFKGKVPIVCCPNVVDTRVNAGHKVERYCQLIINRKIPCYLSRFARDVNLKIDPDSMTENSSLTTTTPEAPINVVQVHGGEEVLTPYHKHMVLIGYGAQNDIKWSCGGSLISARYVLSASHCVNPFSLGPARWAKMGDLDLSSNTDDARPVTKRIVERITHPDYAESQAYHDIALFKLDSNVNFNPWIMPVCLHNKRTISDLTATVTGWGRTDFAEGTSDKLLEADLNVYNETECKRLMFSSENSKTPKGYQVDLMFCAGVSDGSKDACLGDSGGPLVVRKVGNCVKTQIGITSYGNQCGLPDSPGVYTRVSNYVPWIESIVFPNDDLI